MDRFGSPGFWEIGYIMSERYHRPPIIVSWILKHFLPDTDTLYLGGDFDEIYNTIYKQEGWMAARLWYWAQVIVSMPTIVNHYS